MCSKILAKEGMIDMVKKLMDAVRRFVKLYKERDDYKGDEGYVSITEELAGVAVEISQLISQMVKNRGV